MKKSVLIGIIVAAVVLVAVVLGVVLSTPSNNGSSTTTTTTTTTTSDNGVSAGGDPDPDPDHTHTEVIDSAVESTCTSTGLTEGKHCSVCNTTLIAQKTIEKLPHTEVVDSAVAPTCTETGLTEGKHCSICNAVIVAQETIGATGHTEVIDPAVQATCTLDGISEGKHCAKCSKILVSQTVVKAKGHTEVIDDAKVASCTTSGLTEGTHCSACNVTIKKQEKTPKAKHQYTETECSVCHIISPTFVKNNSKAKRTSEDAYGNSVVYYYYDGVLVIKGSGNMPSFGMYSSYDWAYYYVERIIIEEGITSVSNYAFDYKSDVVEVELPETLKTIGASAFSGCDKLTSITIPNSVTVISDLALSCRDLEEIYYEGQLESLAYNAFRNTAYIRNDENWDGDIFYFANFLVMINAEYSGTDVINWKGDVRIDKAGITTICPQAFSGCNLIENIILGDEIKGIGYRAFMGCTSLKSITFSSNVTAMANNVFNGCSNLRYIYYGGTTEQWSNVKKWADWNKNTGYYQVVCSNGSIGKWSS